jgi:hypothetical protein
MKAIVQLEGLGESKFRLLKPYGRTMTQELTNLLAEMSTRNIPGV